MKQDDHPMDTNLQIYEVAAKWLVELRSGDDDSVRAQFDAWIRQSPQHVRAYLELMGAWEEAERAARRNTTAAARLVADASAEQNVVGLHFAEGNALASVEESSEPPTFAHRHTAIHSWARSVLIAAALVLAVAGISWYMLSRDFTYTTNIGEVRAIALSDGSIVKLNSRTRVRIRLSDEERRVELLEGQALFEVAKEPARPFVVRTGSAQVRAVGTQFDVYQHNHGTTVTVVEGTVAVRSGVEGGGLSSLFESGTRDRVSAKRDALLTAGEQLTATAQSIGSPTHVDVSATTAWTEQRLVFQFAPLSEVAEELSRYSARHVVVEGTHLGDFHVSGAFSSADTRTLLLFLADQPELVVKATDREIRIVQK